jgi:predicted ArsR family transcriptional regulator
MTASRKLILDFLQRNPFASPGEISLALGTTAANIRHHLSILIDEGAIEVVAQRPPRGRGRPAHLYALASHAHRNNLDGLANAVLDILLSKASSSDKNEALREIAGALVQGDITVPAPRMAQRFTQAVQRLNELGYKAHWEAHSQAPHLVLGHCPYIALLANHPELCQMDTYLLEHLSGVAMVQVRKRAPDTRGVKYCLFIPAKS